MISNMWQVPFYFLHISILVYPVLSTTIIKIFLDLEIYNHVVLCNTGVKDTDLDQIASISYKYEITIETDECLNMLIYSELSNALIYFDEPELSQIERLVNQRGAQKALDSNTWLIKTSNKSRQLSDYFKNSSLRFGLWVNIFLAKTNGNDILLFQGNGIGTKTLQAKV